MSRSFLSLLFGVGAFCLAASGAHAGGSWSGKDAGPVAPTWHGLYLGGHIGGGRADWSGIFEGDDAPGFIARAEGLDLGGVVGGLLVGYNFQSGPWVYGIEGDYGWMDWSDQVTDVADADDFIIGEVENLASVRGRFGYASQGLMVFATLGPAWVDATYRAHDDTSGFTGSVNLDEVGLAVGGGVEARLGSKTALRLEGLGYFFDERHDTATLTPDSAPGDFVEFEDIYVVRAAITVSLQPWLHR